METSTELKWVTSARNLSGYRLALTFNDGSQRIFDCEPLIEQYPIFDLLRDKAVSEKELAEKRLKERKPEIEAQIAEMENRLSVLKGEVSKAEQNKAAGDQTKGETK